MVASIVVRAITFVVLSGLEGAMDFPTYVDIARTHFARLLLMLSAAHRSCITHQRSINDERLSYNTVCSHWRPYGYHGLCDVPQSSSCRRLCVISTPCTSYNLYNPYIYANTKLGRLPTLIQTLSALRSLLPQTSWLSRPVDPMLFRLPDEYTVNEASTLQCEGLAVMQRLALFSSHRVTGQINCA